MPLRPISYVPGLNCFISFACIYSPAADLAGAATTMFLMLFCSSVFHLRRFFPIHNILLLRICSCLTVHALFASVTIFAAAVAVALAFILHNDVHLMRFNVQNHYHNQIDLCFLRSLFSCAANLMQSARSILL